MNRLPQAEPVSTAYRIRVYNCHLDGYGHVNNARYLEFLEQARWAFFRQHDLLTELKAVHLVVLRADIRYRRAAVLDDELQIFSRPVSLRARQIVLNQRILLADGSRIAEADITLMPTQNGKAARLPDALLERLNGLPETQLKGFQLTGQHIKHNPVSCPDSDGLTPPE